MGDVGGTAQAVASVADTSMTNATNMYEAQQNRDFNAQQATQQQNFEASAQQESQAFNAQQAALTRQYQTSERLATQDYNTMMSNTAEQRRMADLTKAGVNPLLAVSGLGGASSPTSQPMSGATASSGIPGAAAGSSGAMPQINSYTQALANLKQTSAQTANVQQQTKKAFQDTRQSEYQADILAVDSSDDALMARASNIQANYSITQDQAVMVANTRNIALQTGMDQAQADLAFKRIQNQLGQMDATGRAATLQSFIAMQTAYNEQQTQEAQNITAAQAGLFGKTIAYAQAIGTGLGTAQKATGLMKDIGAMIP